TAGKDGRPDIWALPLEGDRTPFPLLATPHVEFNPAVSPDGRWFAYASNESGSMEVYVRPFLPRGGDASGAGPKWLVSTNGGRFPAWSADGRQLGYATPDAFQIVDVAVTGGVPVFRAADRQGFAVSSRATDASPDLKRLLLAVPYDKSSAPVMNVLLHWPSIVK